MNAKQNTDPHTFPIPESEIQRLNKVEEQLHHQPLLVRTRDLVRAYRWQTLAATLLTGILSGVCLRRLTEPCPKG
jgi:hypothetical protein